MLTAQPKRHSADHRQCCSVLKAGYFWLISIRCRAESTKLGSFIFLGTSFLRHVAICSFYVSVPVFIYDNIGPVLQSAMEVRNSVLCQKFAVIDMRSANFDTGSQTVVIAME